MRPSCVDSFKELDELFKRSLTKEGDLVYYPVILETTKRSSGKIKCSKPEITVRYTDGSRDTLTTSAFDYGPMSSTPVDIREENEIPVIAVNRLNSDSYGLQFLNAAYDCKKRNIVVMDLRSCYGGNASVVEKWTANYAQRLVWANTVRLLSSGTVDPLVKYALAHSEEEFVPMDNTLIMLSSKRTCSAAELMIDTGYNMENTLIIGENTCGCLTGSMGNTLKLPNSGMYVEFGAGLILHPDGHFEEYRGFLPDIWCPADEAKEAVMNFIAKNTTVTYEQTEE